MSELADVRQIRGLGSEVARQYLWEAIFNPPAAVRAGNANAESMKIRCMSTVLPENAADIYELNFKSTKIQYAGRDASGKTLQVTFFDTEDMQIYKTFYNWVDYTKSFPKALYEADFTMVLLNRTRDEAILTMTLNGCFPENLQEVTLDYTGSDPLQISTSLRYDFATVV